MAVYVKVHRIFILKFILGSVIMAKTSVSYSGRGKNCNFYLTE